jgi:hypothetical protein
MRENRTSGSMSGRWKRSTVGPVRHRQPKGSATDMPSLRHRATSRLYRFSGAPSPFGSSCTGPPLLARRAGRRKLLRNRLSRPEIPAERAGGRRAATKPPRMLVTRSRHRKSRMSALIARCAALRKLPSSRPLAPVGAKLTPSRGTDFASVPPEPVQPGRPRLRAVSAPHARQRHALWVLVRTCPEAAKTEASSGHFKDTHPPFGPFTEPPKNDVNHG